MNTPILTLPKLDDETAAKLNDFLYEILDAFEAHYCYQILRHHRDLRAHRMLNAPSLFEDDEELPF